MRLIESIQTIFGWISIILVGLLVILLSVLLNPWLWVIGLLFFIATRLSGF